MTVCALVRQFLDASDGPRWSCEIIAALREAGHVVKPSVLTAMAGNGYLVKHESPGQPIGFTVGRRPQPVVGDAAARREKDRLRHEAKRRARGAIPRKSANVQPQVRRPLVSVGKPVTRGAMQTSEDFIRAGGVVQVLPGFQRDNVFPQRRPSFPTARGGQHQ